MRLDIKSIMHRIILVVFFLSFLQMGFSESLANKDSASASKTFVIHKISVEGNKTTKESIILRELVFSEGDTLRASALDSAINKSKQNVLNTSLFHFADFDTVSNDNLMDVKIKVYERWYIWPNPLFELADRNFNVWWQTKDFTRTTFGMFFYRENFRGRGEKFYLLLKFQYTQQFGLGYTVPYLNKRKKSGLSFSAAHSRWHEVAVKSLNNKLVFFKDHDKFSRREWSVSGSYSYRPKLYFSHSFSAEYKNNSVNDTVVKLNSDYFLNGETEQRYLRFGYKFRIDHRDAVAYPLNGYFFDCEIVPTFMGFGTPKRELVWLLPNFREYFQVYKKMYFAYSVKGKISGSAKQPYFNERGLGYSNDFIRGYEYYVLDAQHYALLKSNIKYNLLKTKIVEAKNLPLDKFNTIPVAIYVNLFYDMGYAWDNQDYKSNSLSNAWNYGYGIGIDYVTYYSLVIRGEFSINRMKEFGFFLHMNAPI